MVRVIALIDKLIEGQKTMANALDTKIQELKAAVTAETAVDQAILTFVKGVPALIAAAVAQASALGATDEQLQSITDVITTITANAKDLSDAIVSGTPADVPPVVGGPPVG